VCQNDNDTESIQHIDGEMTTLLKQAIEVDPNNTNLAEAYNNLGFVYQQQGKFDDAIVVYQSQS